MTAYWDSKTESWYTQFWYKDAVGQRKHTTKRGFKTQVEALRYEAQEHARLNESLTMSFLDFYELYRHDIGPKLKQTTWQTKEHLVNTKILPYFCDKAVCDIKPLDIVRWQNEMRESTDKFGNPYSPSYLRTIENQLVAIFNHAVKYYALTKNPCSKCDRIGSKRGAKQDFWTKEEYKAFSLATMDKPVSFLAFEYLYWMGIRVGELLALRPIDVLIESKQLNIDKTYSRIDGEDLITSPKTKKSIRKPTMPEFLIHETLDYLEANPDIKPTDRMFPITKHFLRHEMDRCAQQVGVKRIRVHDLRHSHVSLLIDLGFTPLAIAERLGHEAVSVTYIYAHLYPDKQKGISSALEDLKEANDVA